MINNFTMFVYNHSPAWAQNAFCTWIGRKYLELRHSGEFDKWAAFYAESRDWSESELLEYQREQTRGVIRHCFSAIPYYAERWRREGLSPDDFRDLPDLKRFPYTNKEDLFEASDRMIATGVDKRGLTKYMTGGSTGMPLPCYYTVQELQQHYAIFWDRMRQGVRFNDRYATFQGKEIVPGSQKSPPYWRENRAVNQRLYSMRHLSPHKLEAYAESLIKTPFVYYQGYASIMTVIAEFMAEHNLKLESPPKAVFSSSEQLRQATRKLFENTWQTKVWDEYCQAEHCALINECEYGNHHAQMDYGIIEYEPIDYEGRYLLAEMICTGFILRVAPKVRYRVGDCVLIDEKAVCQCGRPGPVIKAIRGRTSDNIITPDGRKYPHISLIVDLLRNVRRVQVVQERVEQITVRVVPFPQYGRQDEKHLLQCFKERIGGGIEAKVEYVDELERLPNGKIPSIINRLKAYQSSAEETMAD